jgi:hypothetical protein
MENTKKFATLVSLVGENPYPIYLGIRELAAPDCTVVLVHSEHTEPIARRIANIVSNEVWFKTKGKIYLEPINDEFDPITVENDLRSIRDKYPNSAINFTGGTKVMSAFGVIAWYKEKGWPATYLAEQCGTFLFADGQTQNLSTHDYSIETLCQLHGTDLANKPAAFGATSAELNEMFENRAAIRAKISRQGDDWQLHLAKSTSDWRELLGCLPPTLANRLDAIELPQNGSQLNNHAFKPYKKASDFLGGKWFEEWMLSKVSAVTDRNAWHTGQELTINGQTFEVDLMTIHNHRLRYVSVTTGKEEKLCKGKAFEAIHRAHQIGGGMADIAVVCLANEALKKISLSVGAGPGKKIKIFGESDAVEWQGGNLDTITEFLTA